jgi:hypothetical protein
MTKGHVVLTNVKQLSGNSWEADYEYEDSGASPTPPAGGKTLPPGYNTSTDVGYSMLLEAMNAAGLTPMGVQGQGRLIVDALNAYWAFGSNPVWLNTKTDAPVWPEFGSIDVTVDSGQPHPPQYPNGQWSFRPDGDTPYQPIGG